MAKPPESTTSSIRSARGGTASHGRSRLMTGLLLCVLIGVQAATPAWAEVPRQNAPAARETPEGGTDYFRKTRDVSEWTYSLAAILALTPLQFIINSSLARIPGLTAGEASASAGLTDADVARLQGMVKRELENAAIKNALSEIRRDSQTILQHNPGNSEDEWVRRSDALAEILNRLEANLNTVYELDSSRKFSSNYIAGARLYASGVLEVVQMKTLDGGGTRGNEYMDGGQIRAKLNVMANRLSTISDWYDRNRNEVKLTQAEFRWDRRDPQVRIAVVWTGTDEDDTDNLLWVENTLHSDNTVNYYNDVYLGGDDTDYGPMNSPHRDRWVEHQAVNAWDESQQEQARREIGIRDFYREEFTSTAAEARAVRDTWVSRMANLGDFQKRIIGMDSAVTSRLPLNSYTDVTGRQRYDYRTPVGQDFVGTMLYGSLGVIDADVFQLAIIGDVNVDLGGARDDDPPLLTVRSESFTPRDVGLVHAYTMPEHTFNVGQMRSSTSSGAFAIAATDTIQGVHPLRQLRTFSIDINGLATPRSQVTISQLVAFTARYGGALVGSGRPEASRNAALVAPRPVVERVGNNARINWSMVGHNSDSLIAIERSADSQRSFQLVHLSPAWLDTWVDSTTSFGLPYDYRIVHYSYDRQAVTLSYNTGDVQHTNAVWSSALVNATSATVRWNPSTASSVAGSYRVQRRLSSESGFTTMGSGSATSGGLMEYVDATVVSGNTYLYRVVPVIPATTTLMSDYSSELSINMSLVPSIPGSVTAQTSNNKQVVSWQYGGPAVTAFVLRRYNSLGQNYNIMGGGNGSVGPIED